MALVAGNRTYYNPTHGIEWRGNLLPYNTFYALLCLFLFFFMAFIFRLCYSQYRFEIRKAALRQEKEKKENERYEKALAAQKARICNGAPNGILKASPSLENVKGEDTKNGGDSAMRGELRVQFLEEAGKSKMDNQKSADNIGKNNDAFENDDSWMTSHL